MNQSFFAMEQARKFIALDKTKPVGKILRSTKQKLQHDKEERERVVKIEVKKRRRMEKRILLSSFDTEQTSKEDYVMKVCPNAVRVLPPLPPHIKKYGGRRRRVTFKLEDTSSC